jgi:hypothetical protein
MKKALIAIPFLLLLTGLAYADLNIELLGILEGEYDGDLFGYSVANLGDINGDRYEDFAIGAPDYPANDDSGRVYICFGDESLELSVDMVLDNPPGVKWFGDCLSGLEDVNGDGCDEFLVGAWGYGVFLYFGGDPPDDIPDRMYYEPIYSYGSNLGAGDVNADGFSDILVAGGGYDSMHVYLGSEEMDTIPDFTLYGSQVGMGGIAVGDVNGDGYDDIVAAGYVDPNIYLTYLYFGRDSLYFEPDVIFDVVFSRGGVGDVNDDGYADIAAWYRVYLGSEEIDTSNYLILPKAKNTGRVGRINRDQYGDIIARNSGPLGLWTQAHIYLGGSEPDSIEDWSSFRTSDNLGYSIAAVDMNADGVDEFILGDPYYLDDSRRGAAYVYSGDTTTLAVDDIGAGLPDDIVLEQNYPNPFNTRTVIEFSVSGAPPATSTLKIYNSRGQLVKTLLEMPLIAGRYHYVWDGTNALGEEVSSGVYFITLDTGHVQESRKALLIR